MKRNIFIILARAALAAVAAVYPLAAAAPLKAETGAPSGISSIVAQMTGKFAKRDHGMDIQINSGQTLTKTTLKLAQGRLDLTIAPPPVVAALRAGKGPYKNLGEAERESAGNLRGLFGFIGGWFHPVVWADSGIESFADIKGRKVFTGPPAGGANLQSASIIRAAAGYEPGRDYESVRLNWGAGLQAMQDGQFDVFMRPAPIGAAIMEQLGAQRKFRLLSLTPEDLQSEEWKKFTANPWHLSGVIPPGVYQGQVNNDEEVVVGAITMQLAAHKSMDADIAYKLTRSFFDNATEAKSAAAVLEHLDENNPLVGMNIPLHPGALRYFRERGVAVPDRLLPPEAQ